MLKQAKRASLAVGKACGVFQLLAGSRRRKSRLLILGYHGVSLHDEHQWRPSLFLSPETFRSRMEALKRYDCHVLPLTEALDLLYRDQLPERAVALTFDDGTYDFRKVVCPILREYGFPATLYLTTYWVTMDRPVVPVIWSYLLWKARGRRYPAPKLMREAVQLDLTNVSGVSTALQTLVAMSNARHLDGPQQDEVTQELASILGVDYADLRRKRLLHLLRPEEVRELADYGVSVQMHMHYHFSPENEWEYKRNLSENRAFITDVVGSAPQHFCYPTGRYQPKFIQWLRDLGVQSATTCDPGMATPHADRMLLPRLVDTSSLSTLELESWVVGIGEVLPHRRMHRAAA